MKTILEFLQALHAKFVSRTQTPADIRPLELTLLAARALGRYCRVVNDARKAAGKRVVTLPLDDAEWAAVAVCGLAALTAERQSLLATDIVALMDLRDRLYEWIPPEEDGKPGASLMRRLPPYWAERNKEHEAAFAERLPEIAAGIRARAEPPREITPVEVPFRPLTADADWEQYVSPTPGQFRAIRDDTAAVNAPPERLTFHWRSAKRILLVSFADATPGTQKRTGIAARLIVEYAGIALDGTVTAEGRIQFQLPPKTDWDVTDATLALAYSRPAYDVELLVPLAITPVVTPAGAKRNGRGTGKWLAFGLALSILAVVLFSRWRAERGADDRVKDDPPKRELVVAQLTGGPYRAGNLGENAAGAYKREPNDGAFRIDTRRVDLRFVSPKAGVFAVIHVGPDGAAAPVPDEPDPTAADEPFLWPGVQSPPVGGRKTVFAVLTPKPAVDWLSAAARDNVPVEGFEAWVRAAAARNGVPWVEVLRVEMVGIPPTPKKE